MKNYFLCIIFAGYLASTFGMTHSHKKITKKSLSFDNINNVIFTLEKLAITAQKHCKDIQNMYEDLNSQSSLALVPHISIETDQEIQEILELNNILTYTVNRQEETLLLVLFDNLEKYRNISSLTACALKEAKKLKNKNLRKSQSMPQLPDKPN